jgi:subtilase family serine protease
MMHTGRSRKLRVAGSTAASIGVIGLLCISQGAGAVRPLGTRGAAVQTRKVCGGTAGGTAQCSAIEVLNPEAVAGAQTKAGNSRRPTSTTRPSSTTSSTTTSSSTTTTTIPSATGCTAAHPGFTPCDLRAAYALPASGGAGQTVAIVDAYNDPNAESDLAVYRAAYGLPSCTTANHCFRKVNQTGGTTAPIANAGWAEEISLDLDMASAVCPTCHILLVEASSNSITNLLTAENTAAALGATTISNSWAANEFSSETSYDSAFLHNIPITASSGDSGYGVGWPASSPYVTAVGGTSLAHDGNARGWSETAWDGAGSGCSAYEPKPGWQTDGCAKRTVADVSAVADPNTGVAVYDSYKVSGWLVFGGTSVSAPIIASVYALAGNGASITPAYPYTHASALFDVSGGSNGSCGSYLCTALGGYDGPTGLGTPNGTGAF